MRQVIIYPGVDNYWVAECPSLPGYQPRKDESRSDYQHQGSHSTLHRSLDEKSQPILEEHFELLLVAV